MVIFGFLDFEYEVRLQLLSKRFYYGILPNWYHTFYLKAQLEIRHS